MMLWSCFGLFSSESHIIFPGKPRNSCLTFSEVTMHHIQVGAVVESFFKATVSFKHHRAVRQLTASTG